jgi:PAS domain S-box-containing protein
MQRQFVRVLLVEDDEDDVLLTKTYLSEIRNFIFEVQCVPDPTSAREKMLLGDQDVFLIDYRLGSENGLDLVKFIQDRGVITPCIILTGKGDLRVDIDASSFGASDYLVKGELNSSVLERSIRYALSQSKSLKDLNEKEKKYRSLFERSVDSIFLANDKLELKEMNESFLRFFDYPKSATESLTANALFSDKTDYEIFKTSIGISRQMKDFEVDLITSKGETKTCLLNCVFIPDQPSGFCCYQGIIHDLTIRKQAENDMLTAERLSLTGKIARTLAHEVRNPLTNLNLALDQLRDELPKNNNSVNLYSDIIERNANRIEQLVGEMLNSSKPKKLQLELISIDEIVEATLALAVDRIELNQIQLQKNYQPHLPRILVDKEKIQIALLNIIINAIEAMELGKGILNIGTSLIDQTITVAISDNGKGIASADLGKLFDPFFTAKQNGMGLGLTSTKNILNSHNAKIEVKSKVGEGTTFFIHFKLAY